MDQDLIENWIERVAVASRPFAEQNSPHSWLVKQSIYTHLRRLATLIAMPWFNDLGGSVLDIGAGTGALSLDLAWHQGARGRVTSVDRDTEALEIARMLAERVGVGITPLAGDATALPVESGTQDTVVARFLFQHLADPPAVVREMRRVARPGGRVAIFGVDDGVTLSDPEEPECVQELYRAIRRLQAQRGGNRLIGRRFYRLMRDAGLKNIQVVVIPGAQMGLQYGRDPGAEAYLVERLLREREGVIKAGLMTAASFETALSAVKERFALDRFELGAEFVATGYVPTA